MGEKIIKPPFYNSGIYDTGSGGGGGSDTVNIGGKTYNTTQIGTLIWIRENLELVCAGIAINPSTTPYENPAAYFKDDNYKKTYGLLYNYYAVSIINNYLSDGWRVPDNSDMDNLFSEIGGASNAYKKLLSKDVNPSSTNEFNFDAIFGGWCASYNDYRDVGVLTRIGCNRTSSGDWYSLQMYSANSSFGQQQYNRFGKSIRLCKNAIN